MNEHDVLAERFEAHRPRLRALAYQALGSTTARRDEPVGVVLPEPVASDAEGSGPEHEALLADSIGPALLVILHTLAPAERLAFTRIAQVTLPALINGAVGIITAADSKPVTLAGFTVTGQKITAIDLIDNPRRIAEADLAILG